MITQIIIFGTNGMLGTYVYNYFKQNVGPDVNIIPLDRTKYDILAQSFQELDTLLLSFSINTPDTNTCIINCAGLIPQRQPINPANKPGFYLVNTIFPQMLSQLADKYKYRLIHITTDCVYNGLDLAYPNTYNESHSSTETNIYGHSKYLGESLGSNTTIIRTSIIGDEFNHTAGTTNNLSFLAWVKHSEQITGWDNHYWNGLTCLQLAIILLQIIRDNLFWTGVRHIHSPNIVSKYQLATYIKDIYSLNNLTIQKISTPISINKALSSIYDTITQFNIPDIYIQLREQAQFAINE